MCSFLQREGPPPGQYKLSKDPILPKGPNVTSPFKSRTPRFAQPHVLVLYALVDFSKCSHGYYDQEIHVHVWVINHARDHETKVHDNAKKIDDNIHMS